MSNNRKTQGDIDKLIKKIQEGIEEYEALYDKFAEAPNAALKERFEGDLKKEIKKLQRLREQVKALVQSPEVKDKKALEVARRRVEEKMEAFKVVERETKTKTFSKEGLANLSNNGNDTPQARTENWIKNAISDLKEQIETAEFELQAEGASGGGGGGKRGKAKAAAKEDPREARLYRLRFNTLKLEQLLRLVVNEDLQPDEVDEIEEDVSRYIEENAEEDFEEEEDLYERFDLPDVPISTRKATDSEEEDNAAAERRKAPPAAATASATAAAAAAPPAAAAAAKAPATKVTTPAVAATPSKATDTPPSGPAKAPATPATAKQAVPATSGQQQQQQAPAKKPEALPTTPVTPATPLSGKKTVAAPAATAAKTPASNPPIASSSSSSSATKPLPASFAAAAAAAAGVVRSGATTTGPQFPSSASSTLGSASNSMLMDGPSGGVAADGDDLMLDDDMDEANDDTFGDDAVPTNNAASLAEMASHTSSLLQSDWERGRPNFQPAAAAASTRGQPLASVTSSIAAPRSVEQSAAAAAAPPAPLAPSPAASSPQQSSPTTATVWSALLKAQQPSEEKVAFHRMLDMSIQNLPHAHDVERVRPFVPPNPYGTKLYHPQTVHPGFTSPEMFKRFDADTLFFIFYYQQQTYQQYLAAKELKRQSYRYHKKFKTWFQRHDKPKESTDEFESGAYLYFDYENGWCQRIKNDFVFKYCYLEDELQ